MYLEASRHPAIDLSRLELLHVLIDSSTLLKAGVAACGRSTSWSKLSIASASFYDSRCRSQARSLAFVLEPHVHSPVSESMVYLNAHLQAPVIALHLLRFVCVAIKQALRKA